MSSSQPTLGQAIDQILGALGPLDESARRTALAAACMQLEIPLGALFAPGASVERAQPQQPAPQPETEQVSAPAASARQSATQQPTPIDIRTFKEQKRPGSARQMACVVAFYLQELAPIAERKEAINAGDLEKYFKQAGFKLPSSMKQTLINLKGAGYMDTAARGEYKLNAVGYNLVAHSMPGSAE